MIAGAVGGLAASCVMNQFQALWNKSVKRKPVKAHPEGEDAAVKTANAIARPFTHRDLTREQAKWAGPAVHYAVGTLVGAAYGALVERVPRVKAASGAVYGTAVWLAADELAVPAFGLAPPLFKTPPSAHVKAFATYLVYGITTDLTRRLFLAGERKLHAI